MDSKSYFGGKRAGGDWKQIISEVPADTTEIIIGFLGNCPIFEWCLVNDFPVVGIEADPEVINIYHCRKHVENVDFFEWIGEKGKWLWPSAMLYLDPPYLLSSRKSSRKRYRYELEREDHVHLLKLARKLPCRVMISGYSGRLYDKMLHDWRYKEWNSVSRGGGVVESLWMNFSYAARVITYDYVGSDKTDRQRIRRKKRRWVKSLKAMPVREREAVLDEIQKAFGG